MPICLHVGTERRAGRPDLRHAQSDSRLSRGGRRRSDRATLLGFSRDAGHRRNLSGTCSRLDYSAWRTLEEGSIAPWSRTRSDVPILQLSVPVEAITSDNIPLSESKLRRYWTRSPAGRAGRLRLS